MVRYNPKALRLSLSVLLLASLGGDPARAEEPAPAPATTVHYSDVGARLGVKDAPLWLHLRMEADGWMGLRSAADASQPDWKSRGTWRFTGVPADDLDAVSGLSSGLRAALGGDMPIAGLRERDLHSRARVLIDVAPETPWRRVQWAVSVCSHHRLLLYRLTFLVTDTGTWVDVDLPKDGSDRGPLGPRRSACFLKVRLFRKSVVDTPSAAFTRLRLTSQVREVYGDTLWEEELPLSEENPPGGLGAPVEAPAEKGAPAETITLDLPTATAPSGAHAGAWRRVSAFLSAPRDEMLRLGEIQNPPPTGGLVPSADVIEVMVRLREAGCVTVSLEGAPPPRVPPEGDGAGSGR